MSARFERGSPGTIFGLADWVDWLDGASRRMFGLSAAGFESAYRGGFFGPGPADDLASVLRLIERLRRRDDPLQPDRLP
jgi:hypothetical protein